MGRRSSDVVFLWCLDGAFDLVVRDDASETVECSDEMRRAKQRNNMVSNIIMKMEAKNKREMQRPR
jgi:hypothetical protein